MTTMFKVQSGVPLPPISRAPKNPRRKFPVHAMKPGDMFFMPERKPKLISAYISRITKGLPGKYTARSCWMRWNRSPAEWVRCEPTDRGAKEGVGVWRIE